MRQRLWAVCFLLISTTASANTGLDLIKAAKSQIGVTLHYDSAYQQINYPGGDVPLERGVCTDVVIRAYRQLNVDLQSLVHEDMKKAWGEYPKIWGLKTPDTNIDHRRVPNLAVFFKRHGQSLPLSQASSKQFLPGDIVTWRLPTGVPHIGLVANQYGTSGNPKIIHNIGYGTRMEDHLFSYEITGHFRYAPSLEH